MPVGCKNGFFLYINDTFAWVAQWIEQWFPKPLVAGSIPAPGTTLKPAFPTICRLFSCCFQIKYILAYFY